MRTFHSDRRWPLLLWCLGWMLLAGTVHGADSDTSGGSFDPFAYAPGLWDEANGLEWFLAYGCTTVVCVVVTSENLGSRCDPGGTQVPVQILSDTGDIVEGEAVCREYMDSGYNAWFLTPAEELMRFLHEASNVTVLLGERTLRFELGAPEPSPPFGWW